MKTAALFSALTLLAVQQTPPAAPARPVPLAANTIAARPDAYYGQTVSITAAVERQLSPSAFIVDQDPAKSTGQEVLVIAPYLTGPVESGKYLTIVGELVKFTPAELATRARGYKPDFAPEIAARYEGRPAIVATTVLNSALVDLAKRVPPPMTPAEEALDKAMKRIGPAFNNLRTASTESNAAAAAEQAKVLSAAFAEADAFWKARGNADAIDWNRTARAHLTVLEKAAAAGNWEQVKTAVADVNRMCSSCHTAYRERFDDGTYRVKSAPPAR